MKTIANLTLYLGLRSEVYDVIEDQNGDIFLSCSFNDEDLPAEIIHIDARVVEAVGSAFLRSAKNHDQKIAPVVIQFPQVRAVR